MLRITIPAKEYWDEVKEIFVYTKEQTLQLEHSLVSLSKWESKWHKPFLHTKEKTREEILNYIQCMTITQNVNLDVYDRLTDKNIQQITDYIDDPMTATTFGDDQKNKKGKKNGEIVTAEIIYNWMIELGIPPEYRKWHLNKLITLIRVREAKSKPPKKKSMKEIMSHNAALNAERRAKLKSKG